MPSAADAAGFRLRPGGGSFRSGCVAHWLLSALRSTFPARRPQTEAFFDQHSIVESGHPDLGKLSVSWHTQGSGKSYSMASFSEKVRCGIFAKFTFLLMIDRNDLDSWVYRTFVGCGVADDKGRCAATGEDRGTIEETFARLKDLFTGLDGEGRRAAEEELSDDEYALFCLLQKENISMADREKVKLASLRLFDAFERADYTAGTLDRERANPGRCRGAHFRPH